MPPAVQGGREARTRVVAHRGASGLVPHGNTPEAFDVTVATGARWAEIDVRRTSDGALVVHHDADVAGAALGRLTLAQARTCAEQAGYTLCTLDEVLDGWGRDLCFDVELKEPGTEAATVATVERHLPPERVVYTSFVDETVAQLRRLVPQAEVGLQAGIPDQAFHDAHLYAGVPEGPVPAGVFSVLFSPLGKKER